MQTRVRKVAHVLERLGLAMAGAASGLFVAALVGTSHSALTNQAFLLLMMIGGAVGFYLGIDTPPLPLTTSTGRPTDGAWVGKIDTPELLSAIGTFLAAFSAFASVGVIVLRHDPHVAWILMIMAGWWSASPCRLSPARSPACAVDQPQASSPDERSDIRRWAHSPPSARDLQRQHQAVSATPLLRKERDRRKRSDAS